MRTAPFRQRFGIFEREAMPKDSLIVLRGALNHPCGFVYSGRSFPESPQPRVNIASESWARAGCCGQLRFEAVESAKTPFCEPFA